MLIYNTDENALVGKGVYSWYDDKWNYISCGCSESSSFQCEGLPLSVDIIKNSNFSQEFTLNYTGNLSIDNVFATLPAGLTSTFISANAGELKFRISGTPDPNAVSSYANIFIRDANNNVLGSCFGMFLNIQDAFIADCSSVETMITATKGVRFSQIFELKYTGVVAPAAVSSSTLAEGLSLRLDNIDTTNKIIRFYIEGTPTMNAVPDISEIIVSDAQNNTLGTCSSIIINIEEGFIPRCNTIVAVKGKQYNSGPLEMNYDRILVPNRVSATNVPEGLILSMVDVNPTTKTLRYIITGTPTTNATSQYININIYRDNDLLGSCSDRLFINLQEPFSADCSSLPSTLNITRNQYYEQELALNYTGAPDPASIVMQLPAGLNASFISARNGVLRFRISGTSSEVANIASLLLIFDQNNNLLLTCNTMAIRVEDSFSINCGNLTPSSINVTKTVEMNTQTITLPYSGTVYPTGVSLSGLPSGLSYRFLGASAGNLTFSISGIPAVNAESGYPTITILGSSNSTIGTCTSLYINVNDVPFTADCASLAPSRATIATNEDYLETFAVNYTGDVPTNIEVIGAPPGVNFEFISAAGNMVRFNLKGKATAIASGNMTLNFKNSSGSTIGICTLPYVVANTVPDCTQPVLLAGLPIYQHPRGQEHAGVVAYFSYRGVAPTGKIEVTGIPPGMIPRGYHGVDKDRHIIGGGFSGTPAPWAPKDNWINITIDGISSLCPANFQLID